MTGQQKEDYLTGKLIRIADEAGVFDEVIKWLSRYRTITDLEEKIESIEQHLN